MDGRQIVAGGDPTGKGLFLLGRESHGRKWFTSQRDRVVGARGRSGNLWPSKSAAELAAEGAACTSSVVPVDWTMVQHVRRMKGGRPGEVTYTQEKTIFVSPSGAGGRRIRGRGRAFDPD